MMFRYLSFILMLFLLNGCYAIVGGHQHFKDSRNDRIGKKVWFTEPFRFENAGKFVRGKIVISGQGFTHITKDNNGNLIYHWDLEEILPHYKKEWVGKCLIYYVVDPKTHIIKDWGFDKGGNPFSCRTWP